MQPCNVLYIHSHDTGRYVRPYGYAVPTPNIQALARQGVLFRSAFCCAPTCSPSRASLLTGQYPHSSGMLGLAHRGFALNDYGRHIIHTLGEAGYHSVLSGIQHVARNSATVGYDEVLPAPGYSEEAVARDAVRWLAGSPKKPFFLSVGFGATHRVFPPPDPADEPQYCRPPAPLPDTPETRYDFACYRSRARMLDKAVGTVLAALERAGLAESTLVICTTDHGVAFPGMKCNLTDHGIGVMLILRGPGGFSGGRACEAMVSHVDLFPTVCELIGVDPPGWLQGRSMMPLIRGEVEQINEEIFAEVTYHAAYEPMRAVRTQRWKYIRRFSERPTGVMCNCDKSPSKDVWLAHGWRDRPVAGEEFFDLVFDPNEAHNLAADPAAKGALDDMRRRLEKFMRATDDPLLKGPVPPPPGARVNHPDCLSPGEKRFIDT